MECKEEKKKRDIILDYFIQKLQNEICTFPDFEEFIKDLVEGTQQEAYMSGLVYLHLKHLQKKRADLVTAVVGVPMVNNLKKLLITSYLVVNKFYDDRAMLNEDYFKLYRYFPLNLTQRELNQYERNYLTLSDFHFNHEQLFQELRNEFKHLEVIIFPSKKQHHTD
jgi:hypothetical protein